MPKKKTYQDSLHEKVSKTNECSKKGKGAQLAREHEILEQLIHQQELEQKIAEEKARKDREKGDIREIRAIERKMAYKRPKEIEMR